MPTQPAITDSALFIGTGTIRVLKFALNFIVLSWVVHCSIFFTLFFKVILSFVPFAELIFQNTYITIQQLFHGVCNGLFIFYSFLKTSQQKKYSYYLMSIIQLCIELFSSKRAISTLKVPEITIYEPRHYIFDL